jgi:uncharacterized damage-inducible protein DinB
MTILLSLLDHAAWADAEAADVIDSLPESAARAQATRLYAHLAAAAHVWLLRLEGRTPAHPVWPDLSLEAARALAAESVAGLRTWAGRDPETLAAEVEYRTSAGHVYRNTVADVITHAALHGSYHRGQLALLARQSGGTPAATDYILFVRGVPAPPSPRREGP